VRWRSAFGFGGKEGKEPPRLSLAVVPSLTRFCRALSVAGLAERPAAARGQEIHAPQGGRQEKEPPPVRVVEPLSYQTGATAAPKTRKKKRKEKNPAKKPNFISILFAFRRRTRKNRNQKRHKAPHAPTARARREEKTKKKTPAASRRGSRRQSPTVEAPPKPRQSSENAQKTAKSVKTKPPTANTPKKPPGRPPARYAAPHTRTRRGVKFQKSGYFSPRLYIAAICQFNKFTNNDRI
jgi:hypothetical protein